MMHVLTEHNLLVFFLQVLVLLGTAKLFGAGFKRLGQSTVAAYILAGILWGPSVLGHILPHVEAFLFPADPVQHSMLETTGWIGILLLLLVMGLEINFASLWRQRGNSLKVGLFSLLIPLAVLAGLMALFGPPLLLFFGGTLTVGAEDGMTRILFVALLLIVPSLPMALSAMRDCELTKTDLGLLTVSALSISDISGWAGFAVLLAILEHESASLPFVAQVLVLTIAFMLFTLGFGRRLMDLVFRAVHRHGNNQAGVNETVLVLAGLVLGILTLAIGIQAFLGFFVAGLICGESKFLNQQARQSINQTVEVVFVPLFFASLGTRFDLGADFDPFLVALVAGAGILLRLVGAGLGGLFAGLNKKQLAIVALLHASGGEIQIVSGLLALEAGILGKPLFVAVVFGALIPSLFVGPMLRRMNRQVSSHNVWDMIRSETVDLNNLARTSNISPAPALVLRTLCYHSAVSELCDPESTSTALLDREEAFSTALGHGLAVPHVETAGRHEFAMTIARCDEGIEWNAPDGESVKVFVLILIPPGNTGTHLQFLKLLAKAWSRPDVRQACLDCPLPQLPDILKKAMEDLARH